MVCVVVVDICVWTVCFDLDVGCSLVDLVTLLFVCLLLFDVCLLFTFVVVVCCCC